MRLALTHVYCWPDVWRGGERILHESAAALARRGHEVTVLSSSTRPGEAIEDGVRVVRLRRPRGHDLGVEARFGRRVFAHLLRGRFDAVHSLGPSDAAASIVATRLGAKHRTVYTNLGYPDRRYWRTRPDWLHHLFVARHVDVYGCMSRYASQWLALDFGRVAACTPGGVRLDRFQPALEREAAPTLLYSGALDEPRKGVAVLLEAVAALAEREPDVQLWLSGPGDARSLLDRGPAAARARTSVLPVGRPQSADVYGRAWATVLPATHETFGIVLVESLASGTPVVGTDHAALPELVSPETGALAAPGDPSSLADACAAALRLAREPGVAGRCRAAAEPYDWQTRLAPRLESLYAGDGVAA